MIPLSSGERGVAEVVPLSRLSSDLGVKGTPLTTFVLLLTLPAVFAFGDGATGA